MTLNWNMKRAYLIISLKAIIFFYYKCHQKKMLLRNIFCLKVWNNLCCHISIHTPTGFKADCKIFVKIQFFSFCRFNTFCISGLKILLILNKLSKIVRLENIRQIWSHLKGGGINFYTSWWWAVGRSGGKVVSVFAFYSDDLSSNPAEVYSFFL